jgi:hypothetical protein
MKAFVNVKVKARSDLARSLEDRYRVRGYPTLLFVDERGEEVDRIVGYGDVEGFTKEVERIRRGEGTLPALREAHEAAPGDVDAALAYAGKLSGSAPGKAVALLEGVAASLSGKDREAEARTWVALAGAAAEAGDTRKAVALYGRVLDERADTEAAPGAAAGVYLFLDEETDPEEGLAFVAKVRKAGGREPIRGALERVALRLHLRAVAAGLRRMAKEAQDPEVLNFAAWEAFERRVALDEATGWARRAVEGSGRKAHVLDTLANLLFVGGEVEEAIALEKEAVGKAEDPAMKREFEEALARFEAVRLVRRAREAGDAEGAK